MQTPTEHIIIVELHIGANKLLYSIKHTEHGTRHTTTVPYTSLCEAGCSHLLNRVC